MPTTYPETELYVKFVDEGDIIHIGPRNAPGPVTDDLRNHTRSLTSNQNEKLLTSLTKKVQTLLEAETEVPHIFGKEGSNARAEWEQLLRIGVSNNIPGAREASQSE